MRQQPSRRVRAQLRVRLRYSPLAAALPLARWLVVAGLLVAGVVGVARWLEPLAAGALQFTLHRVSATGGAVGVQGIAAADVNGDERIDLITGGLDGIKVYRNVDNKTFETRVLDDVTGERVQALDFDGDGDRDVLATLKGTQPSLKWYRNDSDLEFTGFTIGTGNDAIAFASDLDTDGAPDIVVSTDEGGLRVLRIWMNDGSGAFVSTTLSADSGVTAVSAGDVDNNGYPDIITGGSQGLQRWKTTNGTTWTKIDIDSGNQNRTHLVVADVNADDKPDIVTADMSGDTVAFYRNQDLTAFERITAATDVDAKTVVVRDLDEDGDEDIIVTSQDANTVIWLDNNGASEFTKITLAENLQSVYGVAVEDIDGDGDFDFATGDHFRGTVFWYERVRAKPIATVPDNIRQATDGSGRITFDTTVSDEDRDPTRLRIQYSLDGQNWDKPWLIAVKASAGSVDLKNSNGFQVGTANAINTNTNDEVKLTLTWDTKSTLNTGGPIVGDVGTMQLRVLPRDAGGNGDHAVSGKFRVDNQVPQGLTGVRVTTVSDTAVTLGWQAPTDSTPSRYTIFYGTDNAAVLEQRSAFWDDVDDAALADIETTSTTITGLEMGKRYTFKVFITDAFGNQAAAPSVRATSAATAPAASPSPSGPAPSLTPVASPSASPSPFGSPSPTPFAASPTPTFFSPSPTPSASASPTLPSALEGNEAPLADAGPDLVVNPKALVVLDGSASTDPDGDTLVYSWRQLAGPQVELFSSRTVTPTFSAGNAGEAYVFSLTVRDPNGASATDTVTIATREAGPLESPGVIVSIESPVPSPVVPVEAERPLVRGFLHPINLILFALSVISTLLSLIDRASFALRERRSKRAAATRRPGEGAAQGRVVHYRTGQPIVGAQVLIFGADGKLRHSERTSALGTFATFFPAGEYTIGVKVEGFAFAPAASKAIVPERGILYTGGKITVRDPNQPIPIVVPMKPVGREVSSLRTRWLHAWQLIQRLGRILSWPIFLTGALLNTVLVFIAPGALYLLLEALYIALVIIKIALEIRVRPAYGLVRDAITHVPLDLAVVRLFEQDTNRLVMTRVTNAQGKFFALPPPGTYTVTVSKPGYGSFSKTDVIITSEHDATLQLTADLMPVAPRMGALSQAQATVI